MSLLKKVLRGDHRALAKAISMIENGDIETENLLRDTYFHTGHAWIIGITGPPGTGKSTLLAKIALEYRRKGLSLGILVFDPSSPISGGAFLGDRLRMTELASDPSIFIRSMASRGGHGGLTKTASHIVRLLDACGKDVILIETVGTGQADADVSKLVDVVIVVLIPDLGDEVQMSKAGLMEIGDIFVVNKADLQHADRLSLDVRNATKEKNGWKPPVLKTTAVKGSGVAELIKIIEEFRKFSDHSGNRKTILQDRASYQLLQEIRRQIDQIFQDRATRGTEFNKAVQDILKRRIDPHTAARRLLNSISKGALKH
ncbi:MAG: methylmalonyl Co-A mutase-associated GTPase MeaB [Thaumarchaeota archaeon]|nr:methylmalonyl Co-A mutase-associated GTPase MeaB [Nitrososphaerota archaeon]